MDRSEAIKILEGFRYYIIHEDTNEALDLAIESLKAEQKVYEAGYKQGRFDESADREYGVGTDCISRADTIKAMCQECKVFPDDEVNCADCTEVAIVRGMPPVKLKDPDDSLLTDDSEACKEQKSKLDCISRADAIAYIDRIINTGLGKNKSLDYIRKYISALPSAETHEIRTETHGVCSDCISRQQVVKMVHKYFVDAIDKTPHEIDEDGYDVYTDMKAVNELLKHNKHISKAIKALPPVTPTVKVRQVDTLIIAAALRDFAQNSERNISDRERAEQLREQVLAYGASMCQPVTPTERTGEWIPVRRTGILERRQNNSMATTTRAIRGR